MRDKVCLAACAVLFLVAAAEPCGAEEWVPAVVTLSDGAVLNGRVLFTGDSIVLSEEAQGRRYTIRVSEMQQLRMLVEKQSMEEKWFFRESGLADKVYTGERYPVRHYLTAVTFHDGRQLEGHIVSRTIYVDDGQQRHRFILRAKEEGRVGQTLEDLQYVASIVFSREGAGARAVIEGTLRSPVGERLQAVVAINCGKLFCIPAAVNAAAGTFRATGCTEGTYDLAAVTDRAIYIFFSRELAEGAGRLSPGQAAEVQAWADKLRDFFPTQRVAYAAGNRERLFALVFQERRGEMTLPGAELLRRYEVWAMHRPAGEWQIEKRFLLWRQVSQDLRVPERQVVIVPALGGHRVAAGVERVAVDVWLGPEGQRGAEQQGAGDGQ